MFGPRVGMNYLARSDALWFLQFAIVGSLQRHMSLRCIGAVRSYCCSSRPVNQFDCRRSLRGWDQKTSRSPPSRRPPCRRPPCRRPTIRRSGFLAQQAAGADRRGCKPRACIRQRDFIWVRHFASCPLGPSLVAAMCGRVAVYLASGLPLLVARQRFAAKLFRDKSNGSRTHFTLSQVLQIQLNILQRFVHTHSMPMICSGVPNLRIPPVCRGIVQRVGDSIWYQFVGFFRT